jgi:hypothetical protein
MGHTVVQLYGLPHGLSTTLRYATLRYATLRYATLRYSTLLYTTLRYSTLYATQYLQNKRSKTVLFILWHFTGRSLHKRHFVPPFASFRRLLQFSLSAKNKNEGPPKNEGNNNNNKKLPLLSTKIVAFINMSI